LAPVVLLVLELLAGDLRVISLSGVTRFGSEAAAGSASGLVNATASLSLGVDPVPVTTQTALAVSD